MIEYIPTFLAIPFGCVVGTAFFIFISCTKKISYQLFAFSGLFATVGVVISSIMNIINVNVMSIELKNAISQIEFCGHLCFAFAALIFLISIYTNIFIENKDGNENKNENKVEKLNANNVPKMRKQI